MSSIKVDTVRPVTADASLTLQGDNSGTGVSGITIDSSGNATFAGTGNNLGTVTSGTISGATIGSGVTFPAGHIVQTVFNTHGAESSFTDNTPTAVANLTKSISLKTSNPYILVILALNSIGKSGSNTALGVRLTADDSGSLDIKLSDMLAYTNDTGQNFGSGVQAYLHNLTSDSSGTTITYTPKFYSAANSSTALINANYSGLGQHSQIILMEIQK